MNEIVAAFDRELSARELLAGLPTQPLAQALAALLGGGFRLVADDGDLLLGARAPSPASVKEPIVIELEPAAYLECEPACEALLAPAARLLTLVLQTMRRHYMASRLHMETVAADYEVLKQKNAALEQSEKRYKALAQDLDRRVQEQVNLIESQQRQLYDAEKLASIGQLAAGVAHEINNPLSFIRSNLVSALGYLSEFADVGKWTRQHETTSLARLWQERDFDFLLQDFAALLHESIEGADRVSRIVTDLKGFSNVDRPEEEVVQLNDNLRSAANLVRAQLRQGIDLELELGDLPPLLCLPSHLNQVFLNLLVNAKQAIEPPGTIRIESEVADRAVRVRVSDTGCGIPPENLSRIFDPFFTTHDVGQGTGLGLTVAHDIVRAHGGRIEVTSRPGQGSIFTIYLPL